MALILDDDDLRQLAKTGKITRGRLPEEKPKAATVEAELQRLRRELQESNAALVAALGKLGEWKPELEVSVCAPEPARRRKWTFTVVRGSDLMITKVIAEAEE